MHRIVAVDPAQHERLTGIREASVRATHAFLDGSDIQNPQAIGFYERMGFRPAGRSPLDGRDKPFPLVHGAPAPPPAARAG